MEILTSILAQIITPILQKELSAFKEEMRKLFVRNENFEKYDDEAQELITQIAKANTAEERWAYVAKIKATRAKHGL